MALNKPYIQYRQRADRLTANKSTSVADLRRFQEELAANIYIDPACGAGNFPNIAYAKLREIETLSWNGANAPALAPAHWISYSNSC